MAGTVEEPTGAFTGMRVEQLEAHQDPHYLIIADA